MMLKKERIAQIHFSAYASPDELRSLCDMAEKWRAHGEAGMVSVHRSAIEAINTDAWSDEKVRMRSIARLTDAMLAAAQKGEA